MCWDSVGLYFMGCWFSERGVHPRTVGEFDDTALMKAFGQAGAGLFSIPAVISAEI